MDECKDCIALRKELLEWAIAKRKAYQKKRNDQKILDPEDIQNQIVLGCEINAYQKLIDQIIRFYATKGTHIIVKANKGAIILTKKDASKQPVEGSTIMLDDESVE
jgi:hypothetical protein